MDLPPDAPRHTMESLQLSRDDYHQLLREHRALLRAYGRAQNCFSEQVRAQEREIARLKSEAMQMRALVIQRDSELAWAREDRAALERTVPGLPRRLRLARRVDELLARIQDLMGERLRSERQAARKAAANRHSGSDPHQAQADSLEASLVAADLVICQTGCLSHGAYWLVQDHCKRTGKACVLVEAPEALRIARIQKTAQGEGRACLTTLQGEGS